MTNTTRIVLVTMFAYALAASVGARGPRTITVTVHSDPEGAMLYANDAPIVSGYTPFVLTYQASKEFRQRKGCLRTTAVKVRWASGAESSVTGIDLCPQNGSQQQFVFIRPDDAPGRQIDLDFALKVAELRRQAQTPPAPENPPLAAPTHCRSIIIGREIFTNCY